MAITTRRVAGPQAALGLYPDQNRLPGRTGRCSQKIPNAFQDLAEFAQQRGGELVSDSHGGVLSGVVLQTLQSRCSTLLEKPVQTALKRR